MARYNYPTSTKRTYKFVQHKKYFIITIIFIILDQLSKLYFSINFSLGESIPIFNWLNFTYLHNYGAAFSIGSEYPISRYILPIISIVASIFIVILMLKSKAANILKLSALSLILAGAFGNFIDRAFFGYVIDFVDINIDLWDYRFAIFNLADSFISVGVVLLLFSKDD